MFTRFTCTLCPDSSFLNDGLSPCISCHNLLLLRDFPGTSIGRYLFTTRGLPIHLVDTVVRYLVPDHEAEFRRQYLRILLLGPPMGGSRFRLTTYASNGMAGSISAREDILDRILMFIV